MGSRTLAETFDSYANWLVFAVFLMAVNLALEAGAYLFGERAAEALNAWASWPARGSGIAVLIASVIWLRRPGERRQKRDIRALLTGYVADAVKRSAFVAFFLTLCLVAVLDVAANNSTMPGDYFVKLSGLSLTAAFSLSYFLIAVLNSAVTPEEGWDQ